MVKQSEGSAFLLAKKDSVILLSKKCWHNKGG